MAKEEALAFITQEIIDEVKRIYEKNIAGEALNINTLIRLYQEREIIIAGEE